MSTKQKTVKVIAHKEKKSIVTAYENKPDFGYIQVQGVTININGNWTKREKRFALIKGPIDELKDLIDFYMDENKNTLPGEIIVREFYEDDEVPESYIKFIGKKADLDECIERDIKKLSQDGPAITHDGRRIVRYSQFYITVPEGVKDILCEHNNTDELEEWREAHPKDNAADLPGGES